MDMHTDPARQLAALCALPQTYKTAAGEEVEIAPVKVRQLAAVVKAADPVFGALAALSALPPQEQGGAFAALLVARLDDVIALVSVLTGRPAEWFQDLDLGDLAGIASLAIEVNADFFVHRLLPAISGMGAAVGRVMLAVAPEPHPAGST